MTSTNPVAHTPSSLVHTTAIGAHNMRGPRMSLADDLRNTPNKRVTLCKTGIWFSEQSEEDRDAARDFLNAGHPASELHRHAVRNGCTAAETTFRAHCNQRCSCYIGGDK